MKCSVKSLVNSLIALDPMYYLQLTISYRYDSTSSGLSEEDLADWLISELGTVGFDSFEQEPSVIRAFVPRDEYDATSTKEVLDTFPVAGFAYTLDLEELPDINWNEEWEKNYFQPILLGEGACLIRAPFHASQPEVGMEIIINPKMAFGTGNHETTSLVGEWILSHSVEGRRVLDMGCGTGILGLIALKRGARHLTAIDIDPWAYANVQENATLSSLSIDKIICGDASALEGKAGYDLILANITRNILLEDMPRYRAVMLPGASLVLSGFYEEDIPLLRARGEELGLTFVMSEVRHRWSLVELRLQA